MPPNVCLDGTYIRARINQKENFCPSIAPSIVRLFASFKNFIAFCANKSSLFPLSAEQWFCSLHWPTGCLCFTLRFHLSWDFNWEWLNWFCNDFSKRPWFWDQDGNILHQFKIWQKILCLAIKVPRPLYNFPQSLFCATLASFSSSLILSFYFNFWAWKAWFSKHNVAFIQNNVFWLHHFGTKAILSFWAAQTISSSLVVSASIAVIVLSVVVFSISVPPMVLISEELINSCLGKSIFCPSGSFCGLNVSRRRLRVVCWIENTGVLNSKVLVELDAPICVLQLPLSFVPNARDNLFTHKHDAQRAKAIFLTNIFDYWQFRSNFENLGAKCPYAPINFEACACNFSCSSILSAVLGSPPRKVV